MNEPNRAALESGGGGATPPRMRRTVQIALVVGTLLRMYAVLASSPEYNLPFTDVYGWPADHGNYVQWARQATSSEAGLMGMYEAKPESRMKVRLSFDETWIHHGHGEGANYPPLALYLVYLEGIVHRALDPEIVANTAVARVVFDALALVCDIILALGIGRLASLLYGARAGDVACLIVFYLPPIWLDSCWWGQTDSWVLAPIVWMVWAMASRRWLLAGVLWGLALSLKPHGILVAPVWAFALLMEWRRVRSETGKPSQQGRIILGGVVALLVLNLTAIPYWLTSGSTWLQESYLRNLADEAPFTTLKAFNIWYVDLLLTYDANVHVMIAGVTKDAWGKLLLLGGLCGCGVLAWQCRTSATRLVWFTGLWLLATVMLPTRVHERYIVMCLPFLVTMALGARRVWVGVGGLIVVGTAQLLVYHWMPPGADAWTKKYEDRAIEHHRKVVAQTPPALLDQIPTLDEALVLGKREFIRVHRQGTASYEWALTLLALCSTCAVAVAAVPRTGRRGTGDDPHEDDIALDGLP